MYDPPAYLWAIPIAGVVGILAATCYVLYRGAQRADLGARGAALVAGAAAVLLGGWFAASAVVAGHGWYHTKLGDGVPWLPIAVVGFLGTLFALFRIPSVRRALTANGMASQLELPHTFRVAGIAFLLMMALGQLPALFALPAGVGDIAAGIAAPFVARQLARGNGRRAARWWNAFGIADLVMALTLGALTVPADQRHSIRSADHRAAARVGPDRRRTGTASSASRVHVNPDHQAKDDHPEREERGMERADWLEDGVKPADARFLMVTAITHHRFSAPIWGAREVRELQAELAEITKRAAEILREHQATLKPAKEPRPRPQYRGVFGAPAW
jgi:hypothetical protein